MVFMADANSPEKPVFQPLNPWDMSEEVRELQELLCAHGFSLRIDGDFGWKTEAAVRVFQRQHGLRIDGIVGVKTWTELIATVQPGSRPLRLGNSGADVRELQGLLQIYGYLVQRTSYFDEATQTAVVQFQRSHHLRADGVVNPITWTVLRAGKPLPQAGIQKPWQISWRKWW